MKLLLMVAVSTLLSSFEVRAGSDAHRLAEKLSALETFVGQFRQSLVDDQGEAIQEDSTGDFWLKRPGYFYWQTKEPFPQLLVSNLKTVWLYDADLEQVTIRDYDERLSRTPALLLSGDVEKITHHYQVSQLDESSYRLIPKDAQELFTELTVYFDNDRLSKMTLLDSLAQLTTFTFIDGIYNTAIDDGRFEFIPPEGTDIVVDH
ncbi:outer membrane lipoprotein carrier protein LolA [Candidatus Endobugula sertula]|uniref:Outer-membrane lipoprotein carrier protein n=1 Tax=Candidatus Endobugula sertula TaxID=62101 RepID=A0A1D2QTQ9_9GAMM|nr:outer membrane lipoprotein carrier protein LolA [Candidatus Endobugula sertula]